MLHRPISAWLNPHGLARNVLPHCEQRFFGLRFFPVVCPVAMSVPLSKASYLQDSLSTWREITLAYLAAVPTGQRRSSAT